MHVGRLIGNYVGWDYHLALYSQIEEGYPPQRRLIWTPEHTGITYAVAVDGHVAHRTTDVYFVGVVKSARACLEVWEYTPGLEWEDLTPVLCFPDDIAILEWVGVDADTHIYTLGRRRCDTTTTTVAYVSTTTTTVAYVSTTTTTAGPVPTTTTAAPTTTTTEPPAECPATGYCSGTCASDYYCDDFDGVACFSVPGSGTCSWTYDSSCIWTKSGDAGVIELSALQCSAGVWTFTMTHGINFQNAVYEKTATAASCPAGVYTKVSGTCSDAPATVTVY